MQSSAFRSILLVAGAFIAAAAIEFGWARALLGIDNRLSDLLVRAESRSRAPDPDIVLVDIDERSIAAMSEVAGSWPWPRSVHGELVAGIAAQNPRAIVFDVLFSEPDRFRPESDAYFNEVLAATPRVYLPAVRQDPAGDAEGALLAQLALALGLPTGAGPADARASLLLPRAVDPKSWRLGLINFLGDADGVGRRYWLRMHVAGWPVPSLPARLAADFDWKTPPGEAMHLAWSGRWQERPRVGYAELYAEFTRREKRRDPREFRDRIVVIGTTATGLHDIRASPVESLHPALDILATAIDNLKNGRSLTPAPAWVPFALAALLCAALGAAFRRGVHTLAIGTALAAASIATAGGAYLLLAQGVRVFVASPLAFGWACYFALAIDGWLRERRSRQRAVDLFSRFVNPHVVQELVAHGGLSREGESREITVLFSDIRGFTSLSENRTPREVVDLLNAYFGRQVDVIFRHGGSLDKFIGDAIMAFWGAPLDDPAHAKNAIACALEMARTLDEFRRDLGDTDAGFDVGIGIHSGPAVVGLIGSETRREYTAIGDTVNLASRIEGLTKGVARILVSEDARAMAGDAFDYLDRGEHAVKGREKTVRLYEPRSKPS